VKVLGNQGEGGAVADGLLPTLDIIVSLVNDIVGRQ
jgi:hypothetical protein